MSNFHPHCTFKNLTWKFNFHLNWTKFIHEQNLVFSTYSTYIGFIFFDYVRPLFSSYIKTPIKKCRLAYLNKYLIFVECNVDGTNILFLANWFNNKPSSIKLLLLLLFHFLLFLPSLSINFFGHKATRQLRFFWHKKS